MDFDRIMQEITGGLTGDGEKDTRYLMEQMQKYRDHEMSREILRACGRLLYQCMPEEKKQAFAQAVNNNMMSHEAVLEEVRFKQHEKKYDEALALMEGLIRKIENAHMFRDDQVSEYHCFSEFFEEALYKFHARPEKEIRRASLPMDLIYAQYGSLLIDLKRLDDAEKALDTAMRWNPASAVIAFERAEVCKLRGDMDDFFCRTVNAFKYAFRPPQVARCFRDLGYYFAEKEMWEEAVGCYTVSMQYEAESKQAMSEMYYIQQKAGKIIPPPGMDRFREIAGEFGFPSGAHKDVTGLSYAYGKHFLEAGDTAGARYCWEITYSLTDDEEIRKMLDDLPAEQADRDE